MNAQHHRSDETPARFGISSPSPHDRNEVVKPSVDAEMRWGRPTMTDLGNRVDDLAVEYQRWTQRVHDTHDAVRYTYGSRAGDWAIADLVAVHVILQMLEKPQVFRYQGLPYSARIGSLAGPLLNGERSDPALMHSVTWDDIQQHLSACPEMVRAAVVCAFVHGCSAEEMAQRMGCTSGESTELRAMAAAYLRRAGRDCVGPSTADGGGDRVAASGAQTSFPPSTDFAEQSNAGEDLYERASANRLQFWAVQARQLQWDHDFGEILDWSNPPFAKWFVGGTLNVAVNCVDRHVAADTVNVSRSTGSASPVTPVKSLTAGCCPMSAELPTTSARSGSWRVTGSPSTCRWSPRRSSRCSRAPAWV